jgi:hypothetical protein
VLQRRGAWREVVVMGIPGHNGSNLARTQANTDIDHPDEAMATGSSAQGQALQEASGLEADDGESDDPMAEGVRTRRLRDT